MSGVRLIFLPFSHLLPLQYNIPIIHTIPLLLHILHLTQKPKQCKIRWVGKLHLLHVGGTLTHKQQGFMVLVGWCDGWINDANPTEPTQQINWTLRPTTLCSISSLFPHSSPPPSTVCASIEAKGRGQMSLIIRRKNIYQLMT
jgi:hypothetical protein